MTLNHHHQLPVFFCTSNFQTPCISRYINKHKITIPRNSKKIIFLIPIPYPSRSLSFPSSFISLSSILSPFHLLSVFLPFPSLSLISLHPLHMCSIALSSHSTVGTSFPFFPSNTCFLSSRSRI
jgi:hypothetical protein